MPKTAPSALRLESMVAIPPALKQRLDAYDAQFKELKSFDGIRELPGMGAIVEDLDAHLRTQTVRTYHCTREPFHGFFKTRGLRLTDLQEHQTQFLKDNGHYFTSVERQTLLDGWERHFHQNRVNLEGRNGKIWMCLSRHSVQNEGTELFFTYFGGEAIYWPFLGSEYVSILEKLRNIGEPVVVELSLPAADLVCFSGLARYALTCYHRRLNPTAHQEEAEAHIKRSVAASEVLEVTPLASFVR